MEQGGKDERAGELGAGGGAAAAQNHVAQAVDILDVHTCEREFVVVIWMCTHVCVRL